MGEVYQDLLQRPPDAAGLASWTGLLDQGTPRAAVAQGIASTGEFRTKQVNSQYRALLGRPADPAGRDSFVSFLGAGGTLEQVRAALLGSTEYFQTRSGGTDAGFLDALFRDALGRTLDSGAADGFGQALRQGVARSTVAGTVVSSSEARKGQVQRLYQGLLRRTAGPGELEAWGVALQQGTRTEQIVAAFLGSEEYFAARVLTVVGPMHRRFVAQVYVDLLQRPAEAAGLESWGALLDRGSPRSQIVLSVTASTEYRVKQVDGHYRALLGRPTDMAGRDGFFAFLGSGGTLEQVRAALLGSAEYFQASGGGTDAGFLNALFRDALGRGPDPVALQGFGQMLAARPPVPRSTVATLVVSSAEARQRVIQGLYQTFLRRTAGPGELTGWVAALQRGTRIEQVVAAFLGSAEYFERLNGQAGPTAPVGAPPLDSTVVTDLAASTEFLYTGSNPLQTGVAPGTIDPQRAAVLRGRVKSRDGTPLRGVTVTVAKHPEYGQTLTRADGMFDMVVNGGGLIAVNYAGDGNLPVQRQVQISRLDYAWLPDVVLTPQDTQTTRIELASAAGMQVARGSLVTDASGTRQATLFFAPGTQATLALPNGTTSALSTLHVRATEYSAGAEGPATQPATLPANVGHTYAVELSVDEAVAARATQVRFSQPVVFYVNNFLNFPVGGAVPVGYYGRTQAEWVASPSGRVVKILGRTNGQVDVDTDGDGTADEGTLGAAGITGAERERLAALYTPGESLWRVSLNHFSSWTMSWVSWVENKAEQLLGCTTDSSTFTGGGHLGGFGGGEIRPCSLTPNQPTPKNDTKRDDCSTECGSLISVENQSLGEPVGVTGTPFSLNYQSERTLGRQAAYTMKVPITGASVPAGLKRIDLEVFVAGQRFMQSFSAEPNQSTTFTWDGKDAYGRTVQGQKPATVRLGYVYSAVYHVPGFGNFSSPFQLSPLPIPSSRARQDVTLWQEWRGALGNWDARGSGLGGWSLSVHQIYDPSSEILYRGDGTQDSMEGLSAVGTITTVAGVHAGEFAQDRDGIPATRARMFPRGVAVSRDGSLYIADGGSNQIRRVGPDGIITAVAGTGQVGEGETGEGVPAIRARLSRLESIALGPDGSLYLTQIESHRIRRAGPDGIITTVAGTGERGYSGDGGPASQARLKDVEGLAVGPDGSLYIVDAGNGRIRRVGRDGIITTVAGTQGENATTADGVPATQALLYATSVAVGPDGSLYIDMLGIGSSRIRRVGPDGIIRTVAGTEQAVYSGDGGPASRARLNEVKGLALWPDGSLYILEGRSHRVRRVGPDGIITTVAGDGTRGDVGDGGPASKARLSNPSAIAVGPDGNLYIADAFNGRIRRVASPLPGISGELLVGAEDGSELYVFNRAGRHLRTLDALTGAVRYQFTYSGSGRLTRVADGDGNVTTVERDAGGNPTALVAPHGQRTTLALNAEGYLTRVTNPANETVALSYANGGLLATLTDPRGNAYRFSYDSLGRLTRDEDPAGGFKILSRTETATSHTITVGTAGGRTTIYLVENLASGGQKLVNTRAGGLQTVTQINADRSRTVTYPDGTVVTTVLGPDPRWGMHAPLIASQTVRSPRGLTQTLATQRTVAMRNPQDPLSLAVQTDHVTINGRTYTITFDAAAKTITERSPEGRQSVTTLDARGRVVQEQVAGFAPVVYAYDDRGRQLTATQGTGPAARTTRYRYNSAGHLEAATDPLERTVGFAYDAAGRVTAQTMPDGRVVGYGYDANGNVTSLTPPGRSAHTFAHTQVGLESAYTAPAVGAMPSQTLTTYNADRQLTRSTRPGGENVDLSYDSAGRLTTLALQRGQFRYGYHAQTGNLTTVAAPGGINLAFGYDGGLLTSEAWAGSVAGSVSRTYDTDFRVASYGINGGQRIDLRYDKDDLLTQAGDLALTRDPQNGRATASALGSVRTAMTYGDFGEPASTSADYQAASLYNVQYTRDKLARITQKTETIGAVTDRYGYTYDPAGHLTEVKKNGTVTAAYTYDSNGNRLSATGPGGSVTGSYDAQDRLTQYGATRYEYTASGELLSKTVGNQITAYQYDALGNLLAATLPNGTRIEYLVDGQNRRIGKKVNGTLVQGLLYQDELKPIAELDAANRIVSRFVYADEANVPAYMIKDGAAYRIITDHLGSPRLVVNAATGQVVQRMDYDAFGNVTADTTPGFQPFGFAGGLYDRDTKLVRFGARDYDAETGRWTAKDPIGFAGGQANLYVYVNQDPINLRDPAGLDVESLPLPYPKPLPYPHPFNTDHSDPVCREHQDKTLEEINKQIREVQRKLREIPIHPRDYDSPQAGKDREAGRKLVKERNDLYQRRNEIDPHGKGIKARNGGAPVDLQAFPSSGGTKA